MHLYTLKKIKTLILDRQNPHFRKFYSKGGTD